MGRLRTEEVRRLLRYLSERLEDSERLAEIEDALRDEDAEEFLREPDLLIYFPEQTVEIVATGIPLDRVAECLNATRRYCLRSMTRQENIMRRRNLIAGLLIVLVLGAAPSVFAQRRKQTPEHIAAIKKCNHDYKQAAKQANADYKAAVKSANKQTGMARAESLAHARKAKSQALAAANLAKDQCVANAPR